MLLVSILSFCRPLSGQVKDIIFNENFGTLVYWEGIASVYANFSGDADYSDHNIRIMGSPVSDYPGASRGSFLVLQNSANSDSLIISNIDHRYYKDLTLSFGINSQVDPLNDFKVSYSTDGQTWTKMDNTNLVSGSWPAKNSRVWGYVSLGDTLPAGGNLDLMICNAKPSKYMYIDDIRLGGVYDSASVGFLSSLKVLRGRLTPSFDPGITEYHVLLPFGSEVTPAVTATAPVSQEKIVIINAPDVTSPDMSKRTTIATVTSGDGFTSQQYNIIFRVDDKQKVYFEDFDVPGQDQYIGSSREYNYRTSDIFTYLGNEYIKVDPWGSKFAEGSGYRRLYISPYDHPEYDTVTFAGIDVSKSRENEISFAFRWSTGWGGIDNFYPSVEIKVDSGNWTDYGAIAGASAFPGASEWSVIRLSGLPKGDILNIRFSKERHSGSVEEYSIDDLTILGKPFSNDTTAGFIAVDGYMLEPPFDPSVQDYTVELEPGTNVIPDVKVIADDSSSIVNISGVTDIHSDDPALRSLIITITAEDGSTGNYRILFQYRIPGSDASLKILETGEGILEPPFRPDITEYTVALAPGTVLPPVITAIPSDANAIVRITNAVNPMSGLETDRTATVTVRSEDSTAVLSYLIRFDSRPLGTSAMLSSLSPGRGQLDPAFDPGTIHYATELLPGEDITPVISFETADSNATVTVVNAPDITSASEADRTTLVIIVAENGINTLVYSVIFNSRPLSAEARLSGISCSAGELFPGFSDDVLAYKVMLPEGGGIPEITAIPADSNAVVIIVPAADLQSENEADRTTTITVVAEDGSTTLTYSILFDLNTGLGLTSAIQGAIRSWPNPGTNNIRISGSSPFNRITITDLSGKTVMVTEVDNTTSAGMDIGTLRAGSYILRTWQKNNLTGTLKIIKR